MREFNRLYVNATLSDVRYFNISRLGHSRSPLEPNTLYMPEGEQHFISSQVLISCSSICEDNFISWIQHDRNLPSLSSPLVRTECTLIWMSIHDVSMTMSSQPRFQILPPRWLQDVIFWDFSLTETPCQDYLTSLIVHAVCVKCTESLGFWCTSIKAHSTPDPSFMSLVAIFLNVPLLSSRVLGPAIQDAASYPGSKSSRVSELSNDIIKNQY